MVSQDSHCSISLEDCALLLRRVSLPVPVAVTRIPRGEVNACFEVLLARGQRLVLKLQVRAPRPEALLREREACELLARAAVPAPRVLDVNVDRDFLPFNYSLLTFLPGIEGDILWPRLPSGRQRTTFRELGRVLGHIHSIALPGDRMLQTLVPPPSQHALVAKQEQSFEELVEAHSRVPFLPSWLLEEVQQFWSERARSLAESDQLCLLHGDYQLFNVKLSPAGMRVVGVFDLDQVETGHPEGDFAAFEGGVLSARADLRESFHEGYNQIRDLGPGFQERITLYTLLRHLRIILAYQGPARQSDGTGASAEAIARLIVGHAGAKRPSPVGRVGIVTPPAESRPGVGFDDPPDTDSVTGQYLAHVIAEGLRQPVAISYWHQNQTMDWQVFPGRSAAKLHFYQVAARLSHAATRDLAVILKTTHSLREAMFYRHLAPLLDAHVPKAYHVVLRSGGAPHWLFLECIPWMVLGPVWEGKEFTKALEGLALVHSRFRSGELLARCDWLPVINREWLVGEFFADMGAIRQLAESQAPSRSLRQDLISLSQRGGAVPGRAGEIAEWLLAQPFTLLHGDYHLANLGTRSLSADAPVVIADWANCGRGPAPMDLAYFLDRVQGLSREKPSRETLVAGYLSLLAAAGEMPSAHEVFQRALDAATFFGDVHSLRDLLANPEWEASWRGDMYYSLEEEVTLRARRATVALMADWPSPSQ